VSGEPRRAETRQGEIPRVRIRSRAADAVRDEAHVRTVKAPEADLPAPEEPPARPGYEVAKRALDVGLALVQLVLTLPAWLLVPVAIKLEDGGPVFFRSERVGRDGRSFGSWKFRSMTPRGDGHDGPHGQAELEEDRVTRVGAFLRATALDELPQLWNILRGDMSYVGPRALLPEEGAAAEDGDVVRLAELPGYRLRHAVRPGLTGLAQVSVPRDASHRRKFRYDVLYVRRRSLSLDLRLIAHSVWISVRGAWPAVGDGDH